MRTVIDCAKAILLVACVAVAIATVGLIDTARVTVRDLPARTDARIASVQKDLAGQVAGTRADLMAQVTGMRADVRGIATMANRRTGQALGIIQGTSDALVDPKAGAVAVLNAQLGTLNGTIAGILKPAQETAQQLDDAAPLWLDCEYNPDCAFNRYQGLAKAAEATAKVIAAEAPKMTANVDKIAASSVGIADSADAAGREVAKAAQKFNAPQTKMQQVRSWLLTIARIYGSI